MTESKTLHQSKHPIIAAKLSLLRDPTQPSKVVRELMRDLAGLLGYEATATLASSTSGTSSVLKDRVALVPVLRSGLGLVEGFLTLLPEAHILHLGIYREEVSLQPVEYYNKLPQNPNVDFCFVLDPVVATGNTAAATVKILTEWGVPETRIKLISVIASKQGIEKLQTEHPDVHIHVSGIDDTLDENGYILPGVGDSGDRLWNTHFKDQKNGMSGRA